MAELKPCPFCGGEVSLVPCDDEGNLHDEAYREHPYNAGRVQRKKLAIHLGYALR